ncbi:MAG: NAD-dependent succinate-semialdehyde dehydrogenase [Burkholderiales bacterium]
MSEARYPALALYVGGQWLSRASGGAIPVVNPADETELGTLPLAGSDELDAALDAAESGFSIWRKTSASERQKTISRATQLLRERAAQIATALTLEQGKPYAQAVREVVLGAEIIDFLAEEGKRLYGRTVPPRSPEVLSQLVARHPVGPVAAFTPWNFPANLPARKLGGALAAGCSVIIKPAEETPATCMEFVRAFHDAGLPPGVLNMVCGRPAEVSARLIASPVIRKVSFTGSARVGRMLGELAAKGIKRYTAELGGHAPVIICRDADAGRAAKASATAKFRNGGQVCTSPTRFYVHRTKFKSFCSVFADEAKAIRVGSGLEDGVAMGPLANMRRLDDMQRFVDDAVERGGKLLCGGYRVGNTGYFYAPTVLAELPPDARVLHEEPFGPIAILQSFDTLDQAIGAANGLPYGLAAYGFTQDIGTAHRLGEELEAGMVGINHFGVSQPETPFGGWKDSGFGHESGLEGLLGYTDVKLFSIAA